MTYSQITSKIRNNTLKLEKKIALSKLAFKGKGSGGLGAKV